MNRDWLQICSNLAIVVGLVVVVYELNQNHLHVRAQLVMDDYTNVLGRHSDVMGENPASVIAKARSNPEQLTEEERIVADAHLSYVYVQLGSQSYMTTLGIFEYWKEIAVPVVNEIYDYPYARAWWKEHRTAKREWAGELDALIDQILGYDDESRTLTN
jgi:hypothetical protein